MAGVIGTRKFAYDVWGDTVSIEAASQPNRVLISATTAKHLGKDFTLDGPHNIETKEHRMVDTFFISRRTEQSGQPLGLGIHSVAS
jgi:adenylate cyclase